MIFVPGSRILPRTLWRPAIVFFTIAQIVLAFAPFLEGRFGPDARAHVEEAGTNAHHAHNDANCVACTARDLMAASEPGSGGMIQISTVVLRPVALAERENESARTPHTQPRAPPVFEA
jgi:hypothetical protein